MSELPKGWSICTLADIGQIVTGKTPSTKEPRFYDGNVPFIKPGDLDHSGLIFQTESFLTDAGAAEVPSLPPQSIVVTCIGNLGKVGLTTRTSATNQQINAVIPDEGINPSFLFHFCKTLKPWLESESSATTISIVNKGIFSKAPVPIAPLAEQPRIAQKLDELLTQVDTLKARIDAIPALLKRFRQSVLATAVSGRLTEEWRTNRHDLNSLNQSDLSEWTQTIFGEICREITVGYVGKMTDQYRDSGVPFLRSQNVRPLRFSPDNILHISEDFHATIFKSRLEPGDLAIVRSGAPGVTCVIPDSLPIANCSDLVIARPSKKLNSWFGCIYMNSEVAQRNVADNQVGVAQQHFNVGSMKKMPINLPPIEEQTEIVRQVEQLFAFADQLEAKVASAKTRIDHLTQSILAKAFRGELVPQDPNDEPASVLLERIKAERAAAPKAKRTRKASA